ncbi:unnamed protein product [Ambrosiozyma monospora]|uniref:Unnamed protein product n=1 Tax=Ambrosiozyma monospora TaxID=43982 RepID=A0A9W6YXF9_AMBMO|nr:unnamed protein product [Ambrosiozyma monospora]
MTQLNHTPTQSFADTSFFIKLSQLKLDVLKLDQSQRAIYGFYNYRTLGKAQASSLTLNENSYDDLETYTSKLPFGVNFVSPGHLQNVNTLEEFKKTDKLKFLKDSGDLVC